MSAYDKLVFELSSPGREGFSLPESDVPVRPLAELVPKRFLRGQPAALPEVSEFDVVRHYSRLSRLNYGVDTHFYPLGSCTMKYNPKINEDMARVPGFARLHPLVRDEDAQGALQLAHDLALMLAEIAGMDAVSLQPAAGAQGELAGVLMIRAYHRSRGEKRTKVLIPDSAHGTNPASTAIAKLSRCRGPAPSERHCIHSGTPSSSKNSLQRVTSRVGTSAVPRAAIRAATSGVS